MITERDIAIFRADVSYLLEGIDACRREKRTLPPPLEARLRLFLLRLATALVPSRESFSPAEWAQIGVICGYVTRFDAQEIPPTTWH